MDILMNDLVHRQMWSRPNIKVRMKNTFHRLDGQRFLIESRNRGHNGEPNINDKSHLSLRSVHFNETLLIYC